MRFSRTQFTDALHMAALEKPRDLSPVPPNARYLANSLPNRHLEREPPEEECRFPLRVP